MAADVVRRVAPTAAILLAVVGLVAIGVAVVGTTGTATGGGVRWPAAIAPIAASVSHDRGLTFVRPVPVHFVPPRTFDRDVAAQTAPTSAATRTDDRRYAAQLRALGLLNGSVNVIAAETATDDHGGVLGYYTPTARAVYLRGKALTPAVRVTLAHELTHALQDQHFGLNRLSRHAVTDGEQFGLTALEEGDAVLDEDDYQATLTPAERRQATVQPTTTGSTSTGSTSTGSTSITVPVLTVTSSVPYVLGPDLVNALYAVGGNARVDRAYARPPGTELDVVQPTDYLERAGTRSVPAPAVPAGDRADGGPQTFGAFTLYLTLAARLPARTALAAADQWAGGSMRQYRTASGRSCLTAELTGRSSAGTAALAGAVSTWAAAMPPGQVTTNAGAGIAAAPVVELTACDPGTAARAGSGTLEGALTLASQRNGVEVDALYAGASPAVAACVVRRALADRALLVHGTAARVRRATGRCSP
ncbi:MAG TPA: hypothetical protein VGG23_09035 [Acidimicrobiales bacterium]